MSEFKGLGQLRKGDVIVSDSGTITTVINYDGHQLMVTDGAKTPYDLENPAHGERISTIRFTEQNVAVPVLVIHSAGDTPTTRPDEHP